MNRELISPWTKILRNHGTPNHANWGESFKFQKSEDFITDTNGEPRNTFSQVGNSVQKSHKLFRKKCVLFKRKRGNSTELISRDKPGRHRHVFSEAPFRAISFGLGFGEAHPHVDAHRPNKHAANTPNCESAFVT